MNETIVWLHVYRMGPPLLPPQLISILIIQDAYSQTRLIRPLLIRHFHLMHWDHYH